MLGLLSQGSSAKTIKSFAAALTFAGVFEANGYAIAVVLVMATVDDDL